jgi:hypothetical protein
LLAALRPCPGCRAFWGESLRVLKVNPLATLITANSVIKHNGALRLLMPLFNLLTCRSTHFWGWWGHYAVRGFRTLHKVNLWNSEGKCCSGISAL